MGWLRAQAEQMAVDPDRMTPRQALEWLYQLKALTDRHLLRVDPQGEVPRIELIHDRLVTVVREARDVRLAREQAERDRLAAAAHAALNRAVTADGHRVEVVANIGGPEEAAPAIELGAEGVGLFRTEVLFLQPGRTLAPTEEEQFAAYRDVAKAFGDQPVIVKDYVKSLTVIFLHQRKETYQRLAEIPSFSNLSF